MSSGESPSTTSIGSPKQLHNSITARGVGHLERPPDGAVEFPVLELADRQI
jgi:hypothetical protein